MALICRFMCRLLSRIPMELVLILLLICAGHCVDGEVCKRASGKSLCKWSCLTSGRIFDLQELDQHDPPIFKDQPGPSGDTATYSYDPCTKFTSASCQSVAICRHTGKTFLSLGKHDGAVFHYEKNSAYIVYTDNNTNSRVYLVCSSDSSKLDVMGLTGNYYNFTLHTEYVCDTTGGKGLSVGSVLLIIFFVLILIYIVGGILYLRFAHGARGVEQIPNYDFWLDFPVLVKDGIVFVSRGCKNEPTYEKI